MVQYWDFWENNGFLGFVLRMNIWAGGHLPYRLAGRGPFMVMNSLSRPFCSMRINWKPLFLLGSISSIAWSIVSSFWWTALSFPKWMVERIENTFSNGNFGMAFLLLFLIASKAHFWFWRRFVSSRFWPFRYYRHLHVLARCLPAEYGNISHINKPHKESVCSLISCFSDFTLHSLFLGDATGTIAKTIHSDLEESAKHFFGALLRKILILILLADSFSSLFSLRPRSRSSGKKKCSRHFKNSKPELFKNSKTNVSHCQNVPNN